MNGDGPAALQRAFEDQLVADRDAGVAGGRDLRLAPPRGRDLVGAYGREREAMALVEAQRGEVVVRRDQVQPRGARRAGGLGDRLDQRAADAAADRERVEGHELAVGAVERVCGDAGTLAVGLGDDGGQLGRAVFAPATDDDVAPAVADDRGRPLALVVAQGAYAQV